MLKKFFSIAMLLTLLISASALSVSAADNIRTDGKYTVVTVDGQGENRLAAIEGCLVEALRLASGSFIDSKTELNNEELNERIIAYSRGSIAKYEVIMADDTMAAEGIYKVKLDVWVESDLLRDGVKVATNKTATVTFSKADLQPEKDDLKVAALENKDSMAATNKSNAASGVDALSAMLERYNPEDFINIKVVGKVTPVKGREAEDLVQVLVEFSFNESLYNDAFIPDLKQVLDSISVKKRDITLKDQRESLRRIRDNKGAPMADNSVVLSGSGLGRDFSVAVYDKPDRFGCRLYSFSKEDAAKILNNTDSPFAKFKGRIARLKGVEIELLDKDGGIVSTEEHKVTLPYLLTDSVIRNNIWAFHPSIMNYMGIYDFVPLYVENKSVTIPLRFELIAEEQEITASINAKLVFEDNFADAAVKTRNALHNAAINLYTQKINKTDFNPGVEVEYPLAQAAFDDLEASEVRNTKGLLLNEVIDRLAELRNKGNHRAFWFTSLELEMQTGNYNDQKKCVPYLTQAAMVNPNAMIRMGEVQEQGFYDVKPNPKRAKFYYDEGRRILSLLASQGMPSAADMLGHVYIEGLGTKQDIPRAERYFQFAEKAGYVDSEYWFWKHYGLTLRQVPVPENRFKDSNVKTCLYAIRENSYVYKPYYIDNNLSPINIRSNWFIDAFRAKYGGNRWSFNYSAFDANGKKERLYADYKE